MEAPTGYKFPFILEIEDREIEIYTNSVSEMSLWIAAFEYLILSTKEVQKIMVENEQIRVKHQEITYNSLTGNTKSNKTLSSHRTSTKYKDAFNEKRHDHSNTDKTISQHGTNINFTPNKIPKKEKPEQFQAQAAKKESLELSLSLENDKFETKSFIDQYEQEEL